MTTLCILGILYDLLLDLPQKTNCTRGLVGAWSGLGRGLVGACSGAGTPESPQLMHIKSRYA
jgi:hypothetical protein